MGTPIRVLMVEDSEDDALLLLRELRRGGFDIEYLRVETADEMVAALRDRRWDIVIADYSLPQFNGLLAVEIVKEKSADLPFILVSGTIGEERAVEAMKAGAHDFILKDKIARIVPVIQRELRDAEDRRKRIEAESSLRESEERFRSLVESMDDVVFTLDDKQRYTGAFGRGLEKQGLSTEALLQKTAGEAFGPRQAHVHEDANRRTLAGDHVVYEWASDGADGARAFQTSLSPMRDAKGTIVGIVGVSTETTERKMMQEQLLLSDRMASVGTLAAGVAHEINNPLAVLAANLDWVSEELLPLLEPDIQDRLREPLVDARDATERVRLIVRDLKIFSRDDEEKRGAIDIVRVLESSLRMASNEIRHRANLIKDYQDVPHVEANEARLGQVFLNLIINAAQAIAEGRAEKNEIRVATSLHSSERVLVTVSDTGTGISEATKARIFDPFFTTKPVGVGTGLGLAICHRIVTALGGEVQVESTVGKGSTFRIFLPVAGARIKQEASRSIPVGVLGRRGHILVVDDEVTIGRAVRRLLIAKHDVTTLTSAREAMERVEAGERFDLILCDLMMPEITGEDLHRELLRIAPDQAERLVFVTGGAFTPGARAFLDHVPNERLEKPVDAGQLRALVRRRLNL